jgi:hypothetical protein
MDSCLLVSSAGGGKGGRGPSPTPSGGLGLYYGAALSYYGVLSAASSAARIHFVQPPMTGLSPPHAALRTVPASGGVSVTHMAPRNNRHHHPREKLNTWENFHCFSSLENWHIFCMCTKRIFDSKTNNT